jgi:hypothetical protein
MFKFKLLLILNSCMFKSKNLKAASCYAIVKAVTMNVFFAGVGVRCALHNRGDAGAEQ